MSAPKCTTASHDAMKRDESVWFSLPHIGYQTIESDDGSAAWLDLRNCQCGSTLCVLVMTRDGKAGAA